MMTTAEGVETIEQFEHRKAEGCTEVQGYLFGAPRPASEVRGRQKFNPKLSDRLAETETAFGWNHCRRRSLKLLFVRLCMKLYE